MPGEVIFSEVLPSLLGISWVLCSLAFKLLYILCKNSVLIGGDHSFNRGCFVALFFYVFLSRTNINVLKFGEFVFVGR